MSLDHAPSFRADLIPRNVEKIEMNFGRALEGSAVDPLVLMLDLRDPLAHTIAAKFGQVDRIDEMCADSAHREELTVVFAGLPQALVSRITKGLIPELETTLDSMDAGPGYVVLAVSGGGATAMTMPPVAG